MLDTGCEVSVVPPVMAEGCELQPVQRKLLAANGSEIPVQGMVTIQGEVGRSRIQIRALVSEHVCEAMLGVDWLENNEVVWDFAKTEINLTGVTHYLKSRPDRALWSRRIVVAEDVTIPCLRRSTFLHSRSTINSAYANVRPCQLGLRNHAFCHQASCQHARWSPIVLSIFLYGY